MPVIFSLTITINHSFFWQTFRKKNMFNVKLNEWTTNYRMYNNFCNFQLIALKRLQKTFQFLHFSCILSTAKPQKLSYVIGMEMIGNHNHFTYRLKWFIAQKSHSFWTWLWLWLENRDWSVRSASPTSSHPSRCLLPTVKWLRSPNTVHKFRGYLPCKD